MRKKQRIQKEGFKETNDKEKEGKFRDSRRATLRRSPSKVVQNRRCQSGCSLDGRGSSPLVRRVEITVCCKGEVCVASRMIKRVVSLTSALNYSRYVPSSSFFLFSFLLASCSNPDSRWNTGLPFFRYASYRTGWKHFKV